MIRIQNEWNIIVLVVVFVGMVNDNLKQIKIKELYGIKIQLKETVMENSIVSLHFFLRF